MIISIDVEKVFDTINILLWWKKKTKKRNSQQRGYRGNIPQHNKGHIWQMYRWHTQRRKAESISFKIRKKTRLTTLTTSIQHSIESLSHSNQTRKRKKRIHIRKEEGKLLLSADDMILYKENHKDDTTKTIRTNKWIKLQNIKLIYRNLLHF